MYLVRGLTCMSFERHRPGVRRFLRHAAAIPVSAMGCGAESDYVMETDPVRLKQRVPPEKKKKKK